jgi:hypothetical protein
LPVGAFGAAEAAQLNDAVARFAHVPIRAISLFLERKRETERLAKRTNTLREKSLVQLMRINFCRAGANLQPANPMSAVGDKAKR